MIGATLLLTQRSGHVGSFTAIAAPSSVGGNNTAGPVTSGNTTVTPSGGVGPYTYVWSRTAGDPGMSATASTSATTAFSETLGPGETTYGTWHCKVTDSTSAFVYTNYVYVTLHATTS